MLYGQAFQLPGVKDRFLQHYAEYDPNYRGEYLTMSTLSEKIDYIGPLAVVVNELFLSPGGILGQG